MVPPDVSEKKRTVLLTGASRGIGHAICDKLLDQGYHVIGIARHFEQENQNSSYFFPYTMDLANLSILPERLKTLVADYPEVEAVIFNAGRGAFGNLEEFSYMQIRSLMDLNFTSHAYLARAFLPQMKKRRRGMFIFIGSEAALSGKRKGSLYCASKFALRGFAQALREECASSNIRVALINPGMVRTSFFDDLDFAPGEESNNAILPEDIACFVAMILSSDENVNVDEINLMPLKKVVRFKNT